MFSPPLNSMLNEASQYDLHIVLINSNLTQVDIAYGLKDLSFRIYSCINDKCKKKKIQNTGENVLELVRAR